MVTRNNLLLLALTAALILCLSPPVAATSAEEGHTSQLDAIMSKAASLMADLQHDISAVATKISTAFSSGELEQSQTDSEMIEDDTFMFYESYLPEEDEIEDLVNDIDFSVYEFHQGEDLDYGTMIDQELAKFPPQPNKTVCKECVEKIAYGIGMKIFNITEGFCKKAFEKKPSPKVMDFCFHLKKDPKRTVMFVMMKLHIHPIFAGILICHHKGYCSMPPPPHPYPHPHPRPHPGHGERPEMNHTYKPQQVISKMHVASKGANMVAQKLSPEIAEYMSKVSFSLSANCTACENQVIQQLESMFMKSAETVCKYADKVPNADVQQFCQMVETKPREAFKMILLELNISMKQLKQQAMMACQQEGICEMPAAPKKSHYAGMKEYRKVQK